MKKQYIEPEMTVEELETTDIVTTSTTTLEVSSWKSTTVVSEWAEQS